MLRGKLKTLRKYRSASEDISDLERRALVEEVVSTLETETGPYESRFGKAPLRLKPSSH